MFTTNGIACTTATVIAATLGITDLDQIDDIDPIRRAHLLLAMFNALQPGVFALSGWDLCGMLTLPVDEVAELLEGGDTRWIHRAAHDLMGVNPAATHSMAGMPRGRSLYGSIPEQLADETSFLRQLAGDPARPLALRHRDQPPDRHPRGVPPRHAGAGPPTRGAGQHQLTVLNFANEDIAGTVRSEHCRPAVRCQTCSRGKATWHRRRPAQLRGGNAAASRHVAAGGVT